MKHATLAAWPLLLASLIQTTHGQTPVLVKDINPMAGDAAPMWLTPFNGQLYFQATTAADGAELWLSDGTDAGTVLAEDLSASFAGGSPTDLTVWNGELYFNAFLDWQIWKTTGGVGNAVMLIDGLRGLGLTPFFSDPLASEVLMFSGWSQASGDLDLWRSDGTLAGTETVGMFVSDPGGPTPREFNTLPTGLVFFAKESATGREPYLTDATTAGTDLITDIQSGTGSGVSDVSGSGAVRVADRLVFPGFASGVGRKIWRTDGTATGTAVAQLATEPEYQNPEYLNAMGDSAYFFADGVAPPNQLWRLDDSAAHPVALTDAPLFRSEQCSSFGSVVYQDKLYFPFTTDTAGCELWVSDGTSAGTGLLKDINPGMPSSFPRFLAEANGVLYLSALTADEGFELWRTNGTQAGTELVADLNPGPAIGLPNTQAAVLDDVLYFVGDDGVLGQELYKLGLDELIFADDFEGP